MDSTEHAVDRANDSGFVVDDQNVCGSHAYCSCAAVCATGNTISICVPAPGLLRTTMLPSTSQTMERQIERPRPLPPGFVVKNGSSTRARCCGAMPYPESTTDSSTCPAAARARTLIEPPT